MSKGVLLSLVAACAALSFVIAGCGGGDDETTSLTKAQFVKQGDAICKQVQIERGQALKGASKLIQEGEKVQSDEFREKLILTILVPNYEKQVERIKALGVPEGEEEKAEALVKAMEKSVKSVEQNPLPAFYNVTQFKEANDLSFELGMKACAV